MPSIGPGVWELKEQDEITWYRVIYLAEIMGVVYVLHCFEKRSSRTSQRDLLLARRRLQEVKAEIVKAKARLRKGEHLAIIKGDIFDNLGLSHSQASELRMRADLLDAILRVVQRHKFTQRQLAVILDDHQPNMSDLINGRIAKFSIEKLVRYADRLGIETQVKFVEHKDRQLAYA